MEPSTAARRRGATLAIAAAALVLVAAGVPAARLPVAALLVSGCAVLLAARQPGGIAWAGCVPVALALAWPEVAGRDLPLGPACADPASPILLRRLGEAALVLGSVAVLLAVLRRSPAELGIAGPGRQASAAGLALVAGGAVASLAVGPVVARPFFGEVAFEVPVAAVAPALAFAAANGVLEEVAYRGAMRTWLGEAIGVRPAILVQGVAFGLAHAGTDVTAFLPLHVTLLSLAGIVAGIVATRMRSLWLVVAVHVGADIALYYGLACRAAA
ncbi:MAG TPA: CPBP family intramembrane glutamic endopeptidase [Candidatus Limnocylindrales bacterium]|nr:CPBP family intramembrane glutamic endopeptidase [Candidatus Limnocylindrales bacterium]